MTEIVLLIVIIALCVLIGFMEHSNRKERKTLLNALKSKDKLEYQDLELLDKTKVEVEKKKEEDIPFEEVDEDRFDKIIKEEANG